MSEEPSVGDNWVRKDIAKWLQNQSVNPRATLLIALLWVGVLISMHWLLPTRTVEARVISPVLFKFREMVGKAPLLNPSIKIFGLDDITVSQIRKSELTLAQWATVMEALDSKHPRAIVIDALFTITDAEKEPGGFEAVERLRAIKTPIYTGAYASPNPIFGRFALTLKDPKYQLEHYIQNQGSMPLSRDEQFELLKVADSRNQFTYGPHISVWNAFNKTGHILYGDDEGSFMPFLMLKDGKTLPHVMLMPFEDIHFQQDRLSINGSIISPARDGSVPINFSARSTYDKNVKPLIQLLGEKYRSRALKSVEENDFVYIMPMFFTGNTDFKPSPIGLIPGAYSHLAVLNSILERSGLRYYEIEPILVVSFAAAIAYLGWWMSPATLVLTLIGSSLLWILGCLLGFAYQGAIFPYLLPQMSMAGVGVGLLLQRIYITDRKARMIRSALEGIVKPEALRMLQRNPEKLSLDARERVITVMFIDIVGFSLMVENQLPRVAFEGLQQLIEDLSHTIHRHGGIVNKTLGDGLLCFFGYSLEDNKETGNHAEEALKAAAEIQRTNIPRILASVAQHDPVFPLRIGINTAAVFMGNLGTGERLDITVIGNGVNFAKRLESACLPHSVLVGPTTFGLIRGKTEFGSCVRRFISIKHREDMVEAWEFDPLSAEPELRKKADEIYEAATSTQRLERRWAVQSNEEEQIIVQTSHGLAKLVKHSALGLEFRLPKHVARGTEIEINLDSVDGTLHRQLAKQGLQKIRVEVRWVQEEKKSYLHGVRFLDLEPRQTELITDILCQFGPKPAGESSVAS